MSESQERKKKRGRPSVTDSAKKRKKSELDARWNKSRINIGQEIERWDALKVQLEMKSHADLAGFLIDRYEVQKAKLARQVAVTSTPACFGASQSPALSRISSADGSSYGRDSDTGMSGMEAMQSDSDHEHPASSKQVKGKTSSFVDPFEISIEISEEDDDDSSVGSDVDYEPSVNITLGPSNAENIENVTFDESEFGVLDEGDIDEEEEAVENVPGILRILSSADQHILTNDRAYIVYQQPLLNLAQLNIGTTCTSQGCSEPVDLVQETVGSAFYIKWICKSHHLIYKWCSQPILNRRLHGGDLLLSASILLSGNNFSKVSLLARFLNLQFVSTSVYLRIQRFYLVPAIKTFWDEKQTELLTSLGEEPLAVLGDGRMDSPGHCAQYCTYTMMENESKKIISIITMDKREADRKSGNLEKLGFLKSMTSLGEKEVAVGEVITDAHMQITAIMKKDFPAVKHSYDIWHAAKNIGKKILKAGQEKQCKALLPWSQHVVNHFWHTTQTANSYQEFIGIWFGVVHHVVNEHEWVFSYGKGTNSCSHGPLTEDREIEWLKKGSAPHTALRKIVMDKRLLNNVPYFIALDKAASTAELENFQHHILMYASKRFAYTPPVYRARNQLAALDYNEHVSRPCHVNKDGSKRYQRLFNKKSTRWTVVEQKTAKQYGHIPELISKIVTLRLEDRIGMHGPAVLEVDDPRRNSKNIAPVPPPPTRELVEQKISGLMKDSAIEKGDD